jgi:amidase
VLISNPMEILVSEWPNCDSRGSNVQSGLCIPKEHTTGPLAGKKIAIKDNVCVAGIPMMNGSNVLEGYVPDVDAAVVTRILEAGGEIVGKAVCESLCFSGGSHTSDTGPVLNQRSAGGSSSGSAALVVSADRHSVYICLNEVPHGPTRSL